MIGVSDRKMMLTQSFSAVRGETTSALLSMTAPPKKFRERNRSMRFAET
jgi:hypothetical protein